MAQTPKELVELYKGPWCGARVHEDQFSAEGRVELAGHTLNSFQTAYRVPSVEYQSSVKGLCIYEIWSFLDDPMVAMDTHLVDAQAYQIYTANKAVWQGAVNGNDT